MAADVASLFAPLAAAAKRSGIGDFLRWWKSELVAMLPAGWRERLRSGEKVLLSFQGDEWIVFRPLLDRAAEAGRLNFGSLDPRGRREAFRRLLAEASASVGNVWLLVPSESVLVREVRLPLAAEEALRDALGFELDRLSPLPPEQAWFDYRLTNRDTASQRLTVMLAVAARAPLEAKLAEARELGASVLGIGWMEDAVGAPVPLNLLPAELRDRPAVSRSILTARVLAGVSLALAAAAVVYPLWLKRESVISLLPRLEKAQAGAIVAERVGKEIEKLASEHNFIVSRRHAQRPVVMLLEDLSRLLPDTTWIQQLEVKSTPKMRELQLSGETGSSSQLIEVLERSGVLANTSFKSPLTKGATPNTERFLVAAEIKPQAIPDPMPDDALIARSRGSGGKAAPPAAAPATPAAAPAPASTPPAGNVPAAAGGSAPAPSNPGGATPGAPSAPGSASRPGSGSATGAPPAPPSMNQPLAPAPPSTNQPQAGSGSVRAPGSASGTPPLPAGGGENASGGGLPKRPPGAQPGG